MLPVNIVAIIVICWQMFSELNNLINISVKLFGHMSALPILLLELYFIDNLDMIARGSSYMAYTLIFISLMIQRALTMMLQYTLDHSCIARYGRHTAKVHAL